VKLHHLHPAEGAKTDPIRVGRGRSGRRGKTAGRGTKGTGARKNVPLYFEGGQMPYQRRVPKLKGFSNPNRVEYAPVNVEVLAAYFDAEVSPADLYAHGLAHKGAPVKILGRGEITKALTVRAHAFSATAKAKIEAAGGTAETISTKPRRTAETTTDA
jgi:large subunit ribosomal protein L15